MWTVWAGRQGWHGVSAGYFWQKQFYHSAVLAVHVWQHSRVPGREEVVSVSGCPTENVAGSCCSQHARCCCTAVTVFLCAALSDVFQRGFGRAWPHWGFCVRLASQAYTSAGVLRLWAVQ